MAGFLKRLGEGVLSNLLAPVFIAALGGAATVAALIVTALQEWFGWISGPALALLALGVFLLVFAAGLALLPRIWIPRGPFGRTFGTAALMMGVSEERNKFVFQRAPELRRECEKVAKGLRDFAEREAKRKPQPPPNLPPQDDAPEQAKFNADMQAFSQRFTTLYHTSWRRKVEPLLADARAMFFGPVPVTSSQFMPERTSPEEVMRLSLELDTLSDNIPVAYNEAVHLARIERLARLKRDGLSLAADLGSFMVERHQAAVRLQEQLALPSSTSADSEPGVPDVRDMHREWQRNVDFSRETEALFAARYGGSVLRVTAELNAFGLADENLERISGWGFPLRVSSYDLPALAGVISALCQKIPYD